MEGIALFVTLKMSFQAQISLHAFVSAGSSMWLAIKSVKDGEASGVVSAGNTGALMAMQNWLPCCQALIAPQWQLFTDRAS